MIISTYFTLCILVFALNGVFRCGIHSVEAAVKSGDLITVFSNINPVHVMVMSDDGEQIDEITTAVSTLQFTTSLSMVNCNVDRVLTSVESLLYSQSHHTVVIDCSPSVVNNLFAKIKNESLENRSVRWLVMGQSTTTKMILPFLRETVQIAIIYPTDTGVAVETSEVNTNNQLEFVKIRFKGRKSQEIFPPLLQKYAKLKGRKLTIATNDNPTTFVQIHIREDGKVVPNGGIDIILLNLMAEEHDFDYELVMTPDGNWGGPKEDGTITGLIGMAARQDVHMSIDDITITALRETVVDFTIPYTAESSIIVSSVPALKSPALTVIRPFYAEVWVGVVLSLLFIGLIGTVMHYFFSRLPASNTQISPSLIDYYFNLLGTFVTQANLISVDSTSIAFLFGIWYFYSRIVTTSYSGALTAALAAPIREKPIDTFDDVIKAIKTTDKNIMMTKDTSMHYMFKRATSGTYKELNDNLDPVETFAYSKLIRYQKAKEGKGIIFTTPLSYYPKAVATGHQNYYIGKETFYMQFYGFALPSGSVFKPAFDKTIQSLVEGGFLQKIIDNVLTDLISVQIMEEIRHPKVSKASNKPINVTQLLGAFILFGIGVGLAMLVAILEIFFIKCEKKTDSDSAYD